MGGLYGMEFWGCRTTPFSWAFFQSFLAFFWTIALFGRTFAFAFEKVGVFISFSYSLSTSYYHISQ
jgi:hypothetical protein